MRGKPGPKRNQILNLSQLGVSRVRSDNWIGLVEREGSDDEPDAELVQHCTVGIYCFVDV